MLNDLKIFNDTESSIVSEVLQTIDVAMNDLDIELIINNNIVLAIHWFFILK